MVRFANLSNPLSVADVAASIGPGLAKAALGGVVNDKQVDVSFVIDTDADLSIITAKDEKGLEIIRHSTAHLWLKQFSNSIPTHK